MLAGPLPIRSFAIFGYSPVLFVICTTIKYEKCSENAGKAASEHFVH